MKSQLLAPLIAGLLVSGCTTTKYSRPIANRDWVHVYTPAEGDVSKDPLFIAKDTIKKTEPSLYGFIVNNGKKEWNFYIDCDAKTATHDLSLSRLSSYEASSDTWSGRYGMRIKNQWRNAAYEFVCGRPIR